MSLPAPEQRWTARPLLSAGVLIFAVGLPFAVSIAAVTVAVRAGLLAEHRWWRLIAVLVLAVVLSAGVERLTRRLLPLAALLKLTMLFPDRAPSRFKIARSAGHDQADELVWSGAAATPISVAESVLTLLAALGTHDRKTRGHSERVRVFADMVAEEMRLPEIDRDRLRWAALLHDIGKLEVPARVLNKPSKLSIGEFSVIKQHPELGAQYASPLLPWLGEWGRGILDHHERYDGGGYPHGAAGTDISMAGRIVAVVDSFETMTAARTYKKPMATKAARRELAACANTQFDPVVVRAFLGISVPALVWAMGPMSFLIQIPFLRSIAEAGARGGAITGQAAATAAGAAVLATTGAGLLPPHPPARPAAAAQAAPSAVPSTPSGDLAGQEATGGSGNTAVSPQAAPQPHPAGVTAGQKLPADPATPLGQPPAPRAASPGRAPLVQTSAPSSATTSSRTNAAPPQAEPVAPSPDPSHSPPAAAAPSGAPSNTPSPSSATTPTASVEPAATAAPSTTPSTGTSAAPSSAAPDSPSPSPSPTATATATGTVPPSPAAATPAPTDATTRAPAPASVAPPSYTLITSAPPATTTSRSATFGLAAGQYECRLNGDNGGWTPCSGSVTYSGLDAGNQAFHVKPAPGSQGPSPEVYHWTVVAPAGTPGMVAVQRTVSAVRDARRTVRNLVEQGAQRLLHAIQMLAALAVSLVRGFFP